MAASWVGEDEGRAGACAASGSSSPGSRRRARTSARCAASTDVVDRFHALDQLLPLLVHQG
eukprot:5946783-Pyramimonas_sp.AAC.1